MHKNTPVTIVNKVSICTHGLTCQECCWLWTGATDSSGYGKVRYNGHQISPHRVIYQGIYNVVLSQDQYVLHKCDTPLCCNWNHLFLGNHAMNMLDRDMKGRAVKGTAQKHHRLCESQVLQIRRLYHSSRGSYTILDLAATFCIGKSIIQRIVRWQDWKHVQGEVLRGIFTV